MFIIIYIYSVLNNLLILRLRCRDGKSSLWRIILIATIMALFSASLGSEILIDRRAYSYMFLQRFPQYLDNLELIFKTTIEPGYIILNIIIFNITQSTFWLYFTTTFIMIFIDLFVIKSISEKHRTVSFYYLISLQFIFGTFLLRQGLAASLLNMAFLMHHKGKKIYKWFFVLLAFSFHATAIYLIPLYIAIGFIKEIDIKKTNLILISILFLPVLYNFAMPLFYGTDLMNRFFETYIDLELGGNYQVIFKGIPYHIITILALKERKKLIEKDNYLGIYIIMATINSVSWMLSANMYWLWRMSMYTMVPSLLLLPHIFEVTLNEYKKNIYKVLIVGSMSIITLREMIITIY